jgi:uncharacterized membrane protein SpoIIM required for sporulation
MVGVWFGALVLGYFQAERFAFPDEMLVDLPRVMSDNLSLLHPGGLADVRVAGGISLLIIYQNLRALLIEAVLGVFTFGVVAVMVFMLPWGLIGYLAGQFSLAGVSPFAIAPFVVPHALLEFPALLLAATAILHWGATTIAIPPGRSLGEVWLEAGADFVRVFVGLVLPLLVVAALLETFLTPIVVAWFFG